MKPTISILAGAGMLVALVFGGPAATYAEDAAAAVWEPANDAERLEQLVAPIALYPDALVALVLPAATQSADVVLAARFLNGGGNVEQVQGQPWDDSVKGLAHYPEVVKWMDTNLEWTRQIGEAYLEDPAEVMSAIQRARKRAQESGILTSTPQQEVVVESGYVRIVPAQPDVIYVPRYDPQIIYVERRFWPPDPWLSFGIGFGVGAWLNYDCDWGRRVIVVDHHHRHRWQHRSNWHRHRFAGRPHFDHGWKAWTPAPGRVRAHRRHFDRHHHVARPGPVTGSPRLDHRAGRDRVERHGGSDRNGSRFGLPRREPSEHPGRRDFRGTQPNRPGEQARTAPRIGVERRRNLDTGSSGAERIRGREQGRRNGERPRAGRPAPTLQSERLNGPSTVVNTPRPAVAAPRVAAPGPRLQRERGSEQRHFRPGERGAPNGRVAQAAPRVVQPPRTPPPQQRVHAAPRPAPAREQAVRSAPSGRQERTAPQHGRNGQRGERSRER